MDGFGRSEYGMRDYADASGNVVMRRPKTAAETLRDEYMASGKPHSVIHRKHHSTRGLVGTIVDVRPLAPQAPTTAFVLFAPQTVGFFNYAIGDAIDSGLGPNDKINATAAQTSLTDKRQTPNSEDLAIHGLSFGQAFLRVKYTEAQIAEAIANSGGGSLNDATLAALQGKIPVADPGSLITCPQMDSPFNLKPTMSAALRPNLVLNGIWGGKSKLYIGMGHQIPWSEGIPYQDATGEPAFSNAFPIPEGYIWRRAGVGQDSQFEVQCELVQNVCVPIQFPFSPLLGQLNQAGVPQYRFPERVIVDIQLDIHVISFSDASTNT